MADKNEVVEGLEEIAIQIEGRATLACQEILTIGKLLCEARAIFLNEDIGFGAWRKERLPWISRKMAGNYMNVYKNGGEKLLNGGGGNNFRGTVLYLLTAPSVPESAREEVLECEETSVKQTKEIIEANKLIEQLKAENKKLNTPVEPNIENLIPELTKLYKGGSLVPARAKHLSVLTPEQQRIYYQDFEQKEFFKKEADTERSKAKNTNEIALKAMKERDEALSKLDKAAGSTEAGLLLEHEKEKKRLAEEYQEKLITERKKARNEASEIFEKLNKDKITEALKAKETAERRAKEAVEKRNAAYAEQTKLSIKLKEYEGVVEAKKPVDYDIGRSQKLMLIMNELAEHIEFIETDVSQLGAEQMPETISTLENLKVFVEEKLEVIMAAKNSVIEIN